YVTDTSRFWVASVLDMELDAEGIRVDTESIVSILVGGVAFTNPDYLGTAPVADAGDIFRLYDTRKLAMTEEFIEKEYFVLKFSQAVRGLDVGAPVEFKGFPIGRVVDIGIEFDWKSKEVLVPVRIEVEQERIERIVSGSTAPAPEESEKMLDVLVQQGLRGQVLPANLLTGKLYVSLDFFAQAEPALVGVTKDGLQEIPTIPTPIEELTKNLSALLEKLQKLPVEEIGQNTLDAIKSIKATGDKLEKVAGSEDLKIALTATRQAMENANALVQDDSATVVELQRALRDLSDAAKSIRSLADQLERHPESLLQGKRRN
ncbi:MAG: MlaD family protein, partial [Desulfovibrionales bacterium]|nr:MlaD family protein [Desulfovibrionales bacterium]